MTALLLVGMALAVRPTEGGMYSFDATDDVQSWDEPTGAVRVHYSVSGPNQVRSGDTDGDGVPDFAQLVAETAAEVIDFYDLDVGLRRPLSEEELGLSPLGGSYAFDFYLVDFGGNADGMFAPDACQDGHCAGYMVMENDFWGYGYPSVASAIDVLTSHELFHAVQSSYQHDLTVWMSEGTAVWGELQFDPDSQDFMWFADVYLEDTGRSLDKPPTGPVPSFAYATCLWWDFLTTRHDTALMDELLVAMEANPGEPLVEVEAVLEARGDTLRDAWSDFAVYNLATGDRAGLIDGYRYAERLEGIRAEAEGDAIDDDNRFYPLATTYYRLDHPGGPLWFGLEEEAPGLWFSLHPVADGAADGPVEAAVASFDGDTAGAWELGEDLPAGGYWLVGTYPELADSSVKVRFCLGDEATARACAPDEGPDDEDPDDTGDEEPAKGCTTAPVGVAGLVLLLPVAAVRRRR